MKEKRFKLYVRDCVWGDDKLYCIAEDINLLFAINLNSSQIELLDVVKEEEILKRILFGGIQSYKNQLFITPIFASDIWNYDLELKRWKCIERRKLTNKAIDSGEIQLSIVHNTKLFIIGSTYPAIICIDLESSERIYIEKPYKDLFYRNPDYEDIFFRKDYVIKENKLYLASCLDNYVLELDMDIHDYKWIKVGSGENKYSGITWDGEYFWLSPRKMTALVRWDGKEDVKEFNLPEECKDGAYSGVVYSEGKVFCSNMYCSNSILFDKKQEKMQVIKKQYMIYKSLSNGSIVSQGIDGNIRIEFRDNSKEYDSSVFLKDLLDFYSQKGICIKYKSEEVLWESKRFHIEDIWNILDLEMDRTDTSVKENGGDFIWNRLKI